MCLLNTSQVDIITRDVKSAGINYSHLNYDLIDHICCDVEHCMQQGISFSEAYTKVREKFNIRDLRHIQQDTLMLIDKNYRIMKKSMKTIGVFSMAIMAFGTLFRVNHWPFGSMLLVLGFLLVTLVFFPALLYTMYREVNHKKQTFLFVIALFGGILFMTGLLFKIQHWQGGSLLNAVSFLLITLVLLPLLIITKIRKAQKNKGISILGLTALMIFTLGLMFKFQHWPGAFILQTTGSILLIAVFLPIYILKGTNDSKSIRADFIFSIISLSFVIALSSMLSLNLESNTISEFVKQENSLRHNTIFIKQESSYLKVKSESNSSVIKISESARELHKTIDELKIKIIQYNNEVGIDEVLAIRSNLELMEDQSKGVDFLLSKNNPDSPLPGLKNQIEDFLTLIDESVNDSIIQLEKIEILLNTIPNTESEHDVISWEESQFESIPAIAAINSLSVLQYRISLAQRDALSILINSKNQ